MNNLSLLPSRPMRAHLVLLVFLLIGSPLIAQVPHPSEIFGFQPGSDHKLANYDQMLQFYHKLAETSDRVVLEEIGSSVLGKPMILLTISSKENIRNRDLYRNISEQLARARISDSQAVQFSREGKAIVWIDGGLHATEVACAQMTPLLAHRVATEESPEMQHIRDNTILLLMPVMNPDGLDIVSSWYERNLGTPFETTRPPELYHHYVGHDNNRDWFMNNMPESEAVTRTLYTRWYPQIVYNHHQTGPSWTRIFIPPFADPVNPNIHPGVTSSVNILGSSMANRFAMKAMPGAVSGVIYSMWWNGGMRTVPYFHNMIGLLTETSHATPSPRFYDPDSIPKYIAARRGGGHPTDGTNIFYSYPWKGGESPFSDPVGYMMTASMAVLRSASDLKDQFLYNIYKMGRDAIDGSRLDGPYAYIFPRDQWNSGEEINLINILKLGGIEVHTLTEEARINDKIYPEGSFIIYGAQAFRPYLYDLMEKQEYPDRRVNGQPETPYDLAGWTLPLQMGIQVDRIDSAHQLPSIILQGSAKSFPGKIINDSNVGYVLSNSSNKSIKTVLMSVYSGIDVYRFEKEFEMEGHVFPRGSFFLHHKNSSAAREMIGRFSREDGLYFWGLDEVPPNIQSVSSPKIGMYKSWVANMDEGWTRWLLEEYGFDLTSLTNEMIKTTDLSEFTAIVFPDQNSNTMLKGHAPGTMPEEFTGGLGLEGSLKLKQYVENGGTIVALDGATEFAIDQFALPMRNSLSSVSSRSFFIPGSLVGIDINREHPIGYGMEDKATAYFVRSSAFETIKLSKTGEGGETELPDAPEPDVEIIANYAKNDILKSGWALGEKRYLAGKAAIVNVPLGEGNIVLFGFRPQFRGQPRGTYKLFFNALIH